MASRSSNKAAVPEAKGALDKFKVRGSNRAGSTVDRRIQRRPDIQTERICRWIYGKENDRAAGKADGREIT